MSRIHKTLIVSIVLCYSGICFSAESIDFETISSRAEKGDAYYQGVLGAIYRRGETGETDYQKAYKWLKLSSDQDNPIGLYNLSILYELGLFVSKDSSIAAGLYAKAYLPMRKMAESGNPRAQVNLGYMLENDANNNDNLQKALRWYEKAANNDHARGQYVLGYKYYHGWGYERDYEKAAEWYTKAAEQNYPAAQHSLGNMYANGIGVSKDYSKAVLLHREAEKFQNNIETISVDSGHYVLNGIDCEGDKIIPGLLPPNYTYDIAEGSCGEACLWSLINSKTFLMSQIEINTIGGDPGRGLHSYELHNILDTYHMEYTDSMDRTWLKYALALINPMNVFFSSSSKYRDYLFNTVIEMVKQGNPIILGIKQYPDKHYFWDSDHFILVVGYNETTNELIFNDFNQRKRINAEDLLAKADGYSIINRYGFLNYIVVKKL